MMIHRSRFFLATLLTAASATAQFKIAEVKTDSAAAPVTVENLEFVTYTPKRTQVKGVLKFHAERPVDSVTVLMTYYRNGQPLGGNTHFLGRDEVSSGAPVTFRLLNYSQSCDAVVFTVVKATSGNEVWDGIGRLASLRDRVGAGFPPDANFEESAWKPKP